MDNKNIDIFKIVEKANEQASKKNDIDEIYNMLDELKKDDSVEDIKNNVNKMNSNNDNIANLRSIDNKSGNIVRRPQLAKATDLSYRYNCFLDIINKVNYGENNSNEYVKGHQKALHKYLLEASNNQDDLYVVEGEVNDELNKDLRSSSIESKGYRDGLYYVYQALKESKRIFSEKIYKELKREI